MFDKNMVFINELKAMGYSVRTRGTGMSCTVSKNDFTADGKICVMKKVPYAVKIQDNKLFRLIENDTEQNILNRNENLMRLISHRSTYILIGLLIMIPLVACMTFLTGKCCSLLLSRGFLLMGVLFAAFDLIVAGIAILSFNYCKKCWCLYDLDISKGISDYNKIKTGEEIDV